MHAYVVRTVDAGPGPAPFSLRRVAPAIYGASMASTVPAQVLRRAMVHGRAARFVLGVAVESLTRGVNAGSRRNALAALEGSAGGTDSAGRHGPTHPGAGPPSVDPERGARRALP